MKRRIAKKIVRNGRLRYRKSTFYTACNTINPRLVQSILKLFRRMLK